MNRGAIQEDHYCPDITNAFGMLLIACVLEMLKCVWGKTCPDSLFKIVTPDDIGFKAVDRSPKGEKTMNAFINPELKILFNSS